METIIIITISYLLGSIPFGFLLTKFFLKTDIRKIGSGNIGATNVLRTGNKFIGYTTLTLDVLKAVIPLLIIKYKFPDFLFLSSLIIFLGHVFPVWLKFKGGKGVATYVGILFCINYFLAFIFIFSWFLVFLISKYSSLSSLIGSLTIAVYQFFTSSDSNYYFFVILFILIFFTHKENIKRLLNNTESKSKIY